MAEQGFKQAVQEVMQSFAKAENRGYLMSFLKDSEPDRQGETTYLCFKKYYHDDTNPFQELMPKLTRFRLIGPYPDAIKDEVKYRLMMDETDRRLIEAKNAGQDLGKLMESEDFRSSIDEFVDRKMHEFFDNENERYYVFVSTDDTEYQAELEKMLKPENAIEVNGEKINLVLASFRKR